MKTLMIASSLAMLLAAPAYAETVKTPEQIVKDHVAAANAGDVDAIMADYADDAVTVMAERTIVGKEAIRAGFTRLVGPDVKKRPVIRPVSITSQGNVGIIKYTTDIGISGSESFVIRDGKIIADAAFFDAPAHH